MKKHFKTILLIIGVLILLLDTAYSKQEPSILHQCFHKTKDENYGFPIHDFPKTLLIARQAEFQVETIENAQPVIIKSSQQFVQPRSKIECGSYPSAKKLHAFLLAPVMIDNRGSEKPSVSFWQFHIVADSKKIGMWNQKEKMISKNLDLFTWLSDPRLKVELFQSSHDQFVLKVKEETAALKKTWILQLDAVL